MRLFFQDHIHTVNHESLYRKGLEAIDQQKYLSAAYLLFTAWVEGNTDAKDIFCGKKKLPKTLTKTLDRELTLLENFQSALCMIAGIGQDKNMIDAVKILQWIAHLPAQVINKKETTVIIVQAAYLLGYIYASKSFPHLKDVNNQLSQQVQEIIEADRYLMIAAQYQYPPALYLLANLHHRQLIESLQISPDLILSDLSHLKLINKMQPTDFLNKIQQLEKFASRQRNIELATTYYRKACQYEHVESFYFFASLYEFIPELHSTPELSLKAYTQAIRLYELGMKHGHIESTVCLARLHEYHLNDDLSAFQYYKKAADAGHIKAMIKIANLLKDNAESMNPLIINGNERFLIMADKEEFNATTSKKLKKS